jgi:Zn-dependent protease
VSGPDTGAPSAPSACAECYAPLPAAALSCPFCHRLVHAAALSQLAEEARQAELSDPHTALAKWRAALALLPPDTRQYQSIQEKVAALSLLAPDGVAARPMKSPAPAWVKRLGPLAPAGLLAWKFKLVVLAVLSKGKLLLLGLTKIGTLGSMVISFGAYALAYGWKFALGLVLSIYVHEMGHVHALTRCGVKASAPMFIPMLGAFVRMKQAPASVAQNARIGLAGPVWGLAGTFFTWLLFWVTGVPVLAPVAHFAAWINLFNLIPVWQLDGARGFSALSRPQRWLAALAIGAAWVVTRETFLLFLLAAAVFQAAGKGSPSQGNQRVLLVYCGLVLALALALLIPGSPQTGW